MSGLKNVPTARGSMALLQPDRGVVEGILPNCPHADLGGYSSREIARYRYIALVTADLDLESVASGTFTDIDDLAFHAGVTVSEASHARRDEFKDMLDAENQTHADERIDHDARFSASQIAGFLAVIPRVLYTTEFTDPDKDLAERARLSRRTIIDWSKVSNHNDATLAYGAAIKKPDIDAENPYTGIRYHTKWFAEEPNGAIGFKPEKLSHLRGEKKTKYVHGKPIIVQEPLLLDAKSNERLFGCPAYKAIPQLYDAMTVAAQNNRFFSDLYRTERQNHSLSIDI